MDWMDQGSRATPGSAAGAGVSPGSTPGCSVASSCSLLPWHRTPVSTVPRQAAPGGLPGGLPACWWAWPGERSPQCWEDCSPFLGLLLSHQRACCDWMIFGQSYSVSQRLWHEHSAEAAGCCREFLRNSCSLDV
jgi:hypothetical protein